MAEKSAICDIAHAVLASVRLIVNGKKVLDRRRFPDPKRGGCFVEV
jgi:hypothetical protein